MHTFGDYLWMLGDKQEPPTIPVLSNHFPDELTFEENIWNPAVDESSTSAESEDKQENGSNHETSTLNQDISQLSQLDINADIEDEANDLRTDVEIMEQLLNQCFLTALKKKIKDSELPILTSTFYRQGEIVYP